MAETEETKPATCTFLFKKSSKKFSARKRKASDSDKDRSSDEEKNAVVKREKKPSSHNPMIQRVSLV
ncbi:hypothetical protein AMELA_G00028360 [Ameiurus melas]|uniref:Uncharacterized protein n=1 Tax=Ameiurus melas TaxID=219545 RepID=A0A7J6BG02_AMEME|nr:hypothetical protein AMELA_G00028360 [Ameiurus melas]